jgi:hypothetical protein
MSPWIRAVLVTVIGVSALGCDGSEFADGFRTADAFQREAWVQVDPSPVDILWVVDTSCSMIDEQEALATNFPGFTEFFLESGVQFRLAVTSTNVGEDGTVGLDGAINDGWLDEGFEDLQEQWVTRALMGIDEGHSKEKGLHAAWTALEELGESTNAGFVRAEANLAVVVVSDEPDYSTLGQSGSADFIGSDEFSVWLDGFKDDPERSQLSAIVGVSPDGVDSPDGCNQEEGNQHGAGAYRGTGYLEAVAATEGVWQSICSDDWSEMLRYLGLLTAGLQDTFVLSKTAYPISIEVTVGGARVLDWEFDLASNSVTFISSETLPRPGQVIEIEYEERVD